MSLSRLITGKREGSESECDSEPPFDDGEFWEEGDERGGGRGKSAEGEAGGGEAAAVGAGHDFE